MQNSIRFCVVLTIITGAIFIITISAIDFLYSGANAQLFSDRRHTNLVIDAPIAVSEDNVYVAWWTNKSGSNEVLFRTSNDNGATFGEPGTDYSWCLFGG